MIAHPDFTFRRPTHDDAQAVVDLMNAGDIAATGEAQTDIEQILDQWNAAYFDLNRDAWLAETRDGRLVGYVECFYEPGDDEVMLFYYIDPAYVATDLAATLLALGEQHAPDRAASAPAGKQLDLLTAFFTNETAGRQLVEANGYQARRFFYRMDITFNEAPPPAVPAVPGVTIRAYDPARDEVALYEALEDSFEDHWRHRRVSLEEWRADKIDSEAYDPTLWLVAETDGEVVGGAVGTMMAGVPWIRMLGVRRTWRKRGIARAILLAFFNTVYARGERRVGLTVDASSPTGATRLYESAGMHITDQRVVYAKPL